MGPVDPTVVETRLDWVLSGPATLINGCDNPATLVTHTLAVNVPDQLDEHLRSFWDIKVVMEFPVYQKNSMRMSHFNMADMTFRFRGNHLMSVCPIIIV